MSPSLRFQRVQLSQQSASQLVHMRRQDGAMKWLRFERNRIGLVRIEIGEFRNDEGGQIVHIVGLNVRPFEVVHIQG